MDRSATFPVFFPFSGVIDGREAGGPFPAVANVTVLATAALAHHAMNASANAASTILVAMLAGEQIAWVAEENNMMLRLEGESAEEREEKRQRQ